MKCARSCYHTPKSNCEKVGGASQNNKTRLNQLTNISQIPLKKKLNK